MAKKRYTRTKFLKKKTNVTDKEIENALETVFREILYPYQTRWILDDSRFKICNKARQIGMSDCIGLEAYIDVLQHNEGAVFVSRSSKQSKLLVDKFNKWVDLFEDLGVKLPKPVDNREEIKINGCSIISLSSNAVTGEGYSGNVYLDEFGLHQNDEQIYKSIFPVSTLGYKVRILSRPFGQNNMFWKIWTGYEGKFKGYSRHKIDIYDAVKEGCDVNIDEIKENYDEEGFAENYECMFIDESSSFLTYELLRSSIAEINKNAEGQKFIGVDLGRSNDATAIMVLNRDDKGVLSLVYTKELKNKRFAEQKLIISEVIDQFSPVSVLIDKGSVGYATAEELEEMYKCVKGVQMNDNLKSEAFSSMKMNFEKGNLQIPDDLDLIDQLHRVKKEYGSGVYKFTAKRDKSGHADSAFALALAVQATGDKKVKPRIILLKG